MKSNIEDTVFWGEDPNVILQTPEFYPVENMSYNRKLNALSRTIIVFTLILFLFTHSFQIIAISIFTLTSIFYLHASHYNLLTEAFSDTIKDTSALNNNINYNQVILETDKKSPAFDVLKKQDIPVSKNTFQLPTSKNPFSNVLLSDYTENKNKKPAPPSDNPMVKNDIINKTLQFIQNSNPTVHDISYNLFNDVHESLSFEQTLRPFYSTPSTTIPNDQTAFADFCYGSMLSCKDGNLFACARNLTNHRNI
jgi:hypothetical protein